MGGLAVREGNLEAPKREPLDWQSDAFTDKDSVYAELERVFDICHGCRRCGLVFGIDHQALSYETEVPLKTRQGLLDDLDS